MTKKKIVYIILVLIILFGSIIRLYKLGEIPSGLHGDEALTGYTAYSILKTGTDLKGVNNIFSFHDINYGGGSTFPSLYSWILVPFVALFGLPIYVDRLPSALFGVLSILLIYLIVKKLLNNLYIAIFAVLFMAINPWAIHISRQGLLESVSLGMVLLGIYLYLLVRKSPYYLIASAFVFGLSFYAYDATRLFVPLIFIALTIYNWKFIIKQKKIGFLSFVVFFGFLLLLLQQIFFLKEIKEYQKSSLINMSTISDRVNVERTRTLAPLWLSSIFHNKILVSYKKVLTNYVSVLSINWLFVNGTSQYQTSTGRQGQFYFFALPLALLGFCYLYQKNRSLLLFLTAWFLLGLLPGGLSTNANPYRNCLALPIPLIFSAVGAGVIFQKLLKMRPIIKYSAFGISSLIVLIFVSSYFFTYFFDYPVYASEFWSKQQNDAIRFAIVNKNNYENVYLNGTGPWLLMFGYFEKTDPLLFQKTLANPINFKGVTTYQFENLYFGNFKEKYKDMKCATNFFPKNSLIITMGDNVNLANDKPIRRFFDPGGVRSVFKAIATTNSSCPLENKKN